MAGPISLQAKPLGERHYRRCLGWGLCSSLVASLLLPALTQAAAQGAAQGAAIEDPGGSCFAPVKGTKLLVPKVGAVHLRADSRSARFYRPGAGAELEYVPSNIEFGKETWHQVKLKRPVRELTRGFIKRNTVAPILFKMPVELSETARGFLYVTIPSRRELALGLSIKDQEQKSFVQLTEENAWVDPLISCSLIRVADLKKTVRFGGERASFFRVDIVPPTQEFEARSLLVYWNGASLVKGPSVSWVCPAPGGKSCAGLVPTFTFPDDPGGSPGRIISPDRQLAFRWSEGRFKSAEYKPGNELLKRMPAGTKLVFDETAGSLLLKSDDGKFTHPVETGRCAKALVTRDGRKALVFASDKECPAPFDRATFLNEGKTAWTRKLKAPLTYDAAAGVELPGANEIKHWNLLSDAGEGAILPILEDGEASTFATRLEMVDASGKTLFDRAGFFDGFLISPNGKQAFFKSNEVAEVIELKNRRTLFKSEKEGLKAALLPDGTLAVLDADEGDRQVWPAAKATKADSKGKKK